MRELVVIAYDDECRAAEVLGTFRRLQQEFLIDLERALYLTKDGAGRLRLHQSANPTRAGGAALAGKLSDVGLETQFMRELSVRLAPGSSALFVLVRYANAERVVPEIEVFGGTVVRTSLRPDVVTGLDGAHSLTPDAGVRLRVALGTSGVRQSA